MDIDTSKLKSYFQLPEEIQKAETTNYLIFISTFFKDMNQNPNINISTDSVKESLKIQVLNELAVNVLRDFHNCLKLNDTQMSLAINLIFKHIAIGLKDDLTVDQIHNNFKGDLLKYIADQVWVNKKIFKKDEVTGIYTIFYDNFLDYATIYTSTLGRKHVLHLETFDVTDVKTDTFLVELNNFDLTNKADYDFLDNYNNDAKLISSEVFSRLASKDHFDEDFGFTVMSKEEMRHLKTLKDKELRLQMILEREKSKIDAQFEEKLKELSIK